MSNVRQYFWLWHLNSFSIINKRMQWRCEVQLRDCANVTLKVGSFAHGVHGVKLLMSSPNTCFGPCNSAAQGCPAGAKAFETGCSCDECVAT